MTTLNSIKISVIVPVYNVEDYLFRCIESLINQTYHNIEICLIDDGSTDNSGKICDDFSEKDDRILSFHKQNEGLSSARNFGIKRCNGQYVSFIDGDDWLEKDAIEKIVGCILQNDVRIVSFGRYDVFDKIKSVGLCPQVEGKISSEDFLKRAFVYDNLDFSACDKVYEMSLWKNFRFPLGVTSEDVSIIYKVIDAAGSVYMLPEPLYNYFHRDNSITTSAFSEKKLDMITHSKEILKYIEEKHPDIIKQAILFRVKSISSVLNMFLKLPENERRKYNWNYLKYASEIRYYKKYWIKEKSFSLHDKIKFSFLYSHPAIFSILNMLFGK